MSLHNINHSDSSIKFDEVRTGVFAQVSAAVKAAATSGATMLIARNAGLLFPNDVMARPDKMTDGHATIMDRHDESENTASGNEADRYRQVV